MHIRGTYMPLSKDTVALVTIHNSAVLTGFYTRLPSAFGGEVWHHCIPMPPHW